MSIPEITKKYTQKKNVSRFAADLGINASRQMVSMWVNGKQEPSILTLIRVIGSDKSTPEAREWARECINALTGFDVRVEQTQGNEIERHR